MKYAASANIIVLCYPAHCTHVLQGLDVVAFSGFKKIWTRRRDQWISDNPFTAFGKTAWLSVWTEAFLEAMKESSIVASFRATGVVPFNPNVVTPNMMAPSIPHSSHGELPLPLASPVKKLIRYHHTLLHQSQRAPSPTPIHPSQDVRMFEIAASLTPERDDDNDMSSEDTDFEDGDGDEITSPAVAADHDMEWSEGGLTLEVVIDPVLLADQQAAESLATALSTSSASILVSEEFLPSTYRLPEIIYGTRPAIPAVDRAIARRPKATSRAAMSAQIDELKRALESSFAREGQARDTFDAQAAQLGLAGMLVNTSQFQLANAEERKKKKKGVRINSNGFARIITHSSLLEASEKIEQENTTNTNIAKYSTRREDEWKAFNKAQLAAHEAWKTEKKRCKEEGRTLTMTPPNPLAKKWEWKEVYPSFDEEVDVDFDEDDEEE